MFWSLSSMLAIHGTPGLKLCAKRSRLQPSLVYCDSVLNETISVLARRAQEQRRVDQFAGLINALLTEVPTDILVWLSSETQRLYDQVIELVRSTSGALNFHDALIALGCQLLGIEVIASFDSDFDQIAWLTRVGTPEAVMAMFG